MNVSFFSTKDYENKSNWTIGKNKPKTNPISSKAKIACRKVRPHPNGHNCNLQVSPRRIKINNELLCSE